MNEELLQKSAEARKSYIAGHGEVLTRLAQEGQRPSVLFIGCVDSRVVPESLLGVGPGELLIVRNVANIVPPYGSENNAVGAAIEFAIGVLEIPRIVICGHTDCGGIKALDAMPPDSPSLEGWLKLAADPEPDGASHRALVEKNVLLQQERLLAYPVVRQALEEQRLTLRAWIWDLEAHAFQCYDERTQQFRAHQD